MITGMGIPKTQSSRPLPIVVSDTVSRYGAKGDEDRKGRWFLRRCCDRHLTAPNRHQRHTRAIGSSDATTRCEEGIGDPDWSGVAADREPIPAGKPSP